MEEVELITIKIFYAYAHTKKDIPLRNELEKHLATLRRQNVITGWSDQNITAGSEWKREVNINLKAADIILLLVSPDFMDSDYCYSLELKEALEKYRMKRVEVLPVLLRPAYWEESFFGHLQPLPRNAQPVSTWKYPDAAFVDVVKEIKMVAKRLLALKYIQKASDFLADGQLANALKVCECSINSDNTLYSSFFTKGNILYQMKRYEDAKNAYLEAISLNPEEAIFYERIGNIYSIYLENYQKALEAYERASTLAPGEAVYHARMGYLLYARLNRYADAIDAYRQASELAPRKAAYHAEIGKILYTRLGKYQEALEAYSQAIKLDPKEAAYHAMIGKILYRHLGRYKDAIEVYQRASNLNPKEATYYAAIGKILSIHIKDHQKALDAYKRASELAPEEAAYYAEIGEILSIYFSLYKEAIMAFKQASRYDPEEAVYHAEIGKLSLYLNDYQEALNAYKRASELAPKEAAYYARIGEILELWSQNMLAQAQKFKRKAIELKHSATEDQSFIERNFKHEENLF